jgi:L-ribulose-5-phosphate 3-epimerase
LSNSISFMTANYVAREVGWAMHGWGHGDKATNEAFAPLGTYEERLDALLGDVRGLGFDTVDIWGAHLNTDWATDEHVEIAQRLLARHGLAVGSYATWVGPSNIERACELAHGLGTTLIGAGYSGDADAVAQVLRKNGLRLGVENHPEEKTPQDVLAKLEGLEDVFGATVDTGWWGTQGYDAAQAIEELGEHVFHVHLKDVLQVGEPHETCPWGEGVVDVEACVRALKRIGYTGVLTIEHEPEDHDPSGEIRALRTRLEGWLR